MTKGIAGPNSSKFPEQALLPMPDVPGHDNSMDIPLRQLCLEWHPRRRESELRKIFADGRAFLPVAVATPAARTPNGVG